MAVTRIFFNARLKTMMILAAVAGAVIALRLVDIQVLRHNAYLKMAERNRTQILYQTAPRGRVFTADGVAVASNAPAFSFYYLSAGRKDPEYLNQLAHDLAPHLKMSEADVLSKVEKGVKTGKATLLAENLSTKSTMALQELQLYYPGVYLIEETKRSYPYGGFASHLIGYIGRMDEREWQKRDQSMGYRLNSKIGKNGIEKKFEKNYSPDQAARAGDSPGICRDIGFFAPVCLLALFGDVQRLRELAGNGHAEKDGVFQDGDRLIDGIEQRHGAHAGSAAGQPVQNGRKQHKHQNHRLARQAGKAGAAVQRAGCGLGALAQRSEHQRAGVVKRHQQQKQAQT